MEEPTLFINLCELCKAWIDDGGAVCKTCIRLPKAERKKLVERRFQELKALGLLKKPKRR